MKIFENEMCNLEWNDELWGIVCTWKNKTDNSDCKKSVEKGLMYLIDREGHSWISDCRAGYENLLNDKQWFNRIFVPTASLSCCKKLAFVTGEDNILKEIIKGKVEDLSRFFEVSIFDNIDDAKIWAG